MPDTEDLETSKLSESDFIARARAQFEADASDEKQLREDFSFDLRMESGDQWDPATANERRNSNRPVMVFNREHTFVQQVSNEARQNKPQIKFSPGEDGDKDTAEIYEGLARYIQYTSQAQVAYETGVEYQAAGGFGFYRLLTEYCDDDSDEQELIMVPVLDPLSVYGILFPAIFGRKPEHAFVVEDIPKDEFRRKYPKSEITSNWDDARESCGEAWVGTDTVKVAEYWWVEEEKVEGRRKPKRKVRFCKMTGAEVLPGTETEWLGSEIPIFAVLGKQRIIDGKPKLYSVIRFQHDAQRLINGYKTRIAETLSVAPISPYMVAEGQLEGHEREWSQIAKNPQVIQYKPKAIGNTLAPPPQRQTFEPPIAALSAAMRDEVDDMKASAGIFDASLGRQSNSISGIAKQRDQQQASLTNMHFLDNLERSFNEHSGPALRELIPLIYDSERMVRILGEDMRPKVVKINGQWDENGKPRHYKVGGAGAGKYDVIVTMGKAFSTKRMESFDMLSEMVAGKPELVVPLGDILFQNSDTAGADQLVERFKKMQPREWHQEEGQQPIPPRAQAAIARAQQEAQAINEYAKTLEQEKQKLEQEKQAKIVDNQFKAQNEAANRELELEKLRIVEGNKLAIAQINAAAQETNLRMQMEREQWNLVHGHAHEYAMQSGQQSHEAEMADRAQLHEGEMAERNAQIAQEQQANQPEA